MAKNPTQKIVTKKHLARLDRELYQRRIILTIASVVFSIILGLVIFGVIDNYYLKARRPLAVVNDDRITLNEFEKNVRFSRWQMLQQYQSTLQVYQYFASDPNFGASLKRDLEKIASDLDPKNSVTLGENVLTRMIEDRLIIQEAARLGIAATDEEVEDFIRSGMNYFPDGEPTPTITPTLMATSTLSPTQLALVTPTPTATPVEPTPTPTVEPTLEATPAAPAAEVENLTATPLPTLEPNPTPTEYTLEGFSTEFAKYLEQLEQLGMSDADFREFIRIQILRQKIFDVVTADVQAVDEQVWARHILVENEDTAKIVLDRLAKGDDWTDLAAEYSKDPSNADKGGDLGWFSQGRMVPEFESAAIELKIGEISPPVETVFGFHIIQKLGQDNRPRTTLDLQNARQSAFDEWLATARDNSVIQENDLWIDRVPTDPALPREILPPA
ncbi:MAG: peptidylprolyl isomerase [Anaerolineaceae bacterium]|nr:peptidylprolyl isomerase [Anaerolineaceae bacterium]